MLSEAGKLACNFRACAETGEFSAWSSQSASVGCWRFFQADFSLIAWRSTMLKSHSWGREEKKKLLTFLFWQVIQRKLLTQLCHQNAGSDGCLFSESYHDLVFFFSDFLLKVFPLCSSDKKDHDSVVPVSGWVLGPNWPFLFWGLRYRVVTWAARMWDVIHGPCYACDGFRGGGTQWEHLKPLQQCSLEASNFLLLLFVLIKK